MEYDLMFCPKETKATLPAMLSLDSEDEMKFIPFG